MLRIRTKTFLTTLLVAQLAYQLQTGVLLNADAMAVSVISRPAGPTRVARAVAWGLLNPFRTNQPLEKDAGENPVYNLGLRSTKISQVDMQGQISTATHTLRAGDIAVRAAPSKRRVKVYRIDEMQADSMANDYMRAIPSPSKVDVKTTATTKTQAEVKTNSLVGSLVQPFQACLDQSCEDIDLDRLVTACKRYTDAVYSFGQKAMSENLKQNLKNIEAAKAHAPKEYQTTVRKLLEYEKANGVRPDGGKLKNGSAAMSLLWIRRSLAFQHRLNECLVEQPDLATSEAAMLAYEQEVQPFHSWGLQKLFKMNLRASTAPRPKTLAQLRGSPCDELDPTEEAMTIAELKSLDETWKLLLHEWKSIFETLDLEDDSKA
mmetsp:Transcript_9470/g.19090  ORF Transcript_9470/g.19090 Transcript_9470/m.19090 type:complete len:376 (+) Transcript_9470:146-1273(+)